MDGDTALGYVCPAGGAEQSGAPRVARASSSGRPIAAGSEAPASTGGPARLSILFLTQNLEPGGAERQLVTLATGLRAAGHDVTIATLHGGGFAAAAQQAGVDVVDLGKGARWDLLGPFARLARAGRRLRPDVLFAVQPAANLLAFAVRPLVGGPRLIWQIVAADLPMHLYPRRTRVAFALEARLAGVADAIVVNSHRGRETALAAGFPDRRLHVVENGFDLETFAPDPEGGRRMRGTWGVPAGARLVGLVARIDPVKGHTHFLQAAAGLAAESDDVYFVCIGGGDARLTARLRVLATELRLDSRLTWAGECGDMPAAYSALDVACLASLSEGLPNVVGEAMACGVPCVVTDVGDAARLVGQSGVVVPPGEPDALAAGLREALDRCAAGGFGDVRARIAKHYPRDALLRRTEALMRDLLGRETA